MTKTYHQQNVLKHFGVLGMHWGQHKTIGLIKVDPTKARAAASSFVSKYSKKKASDLVKETNTPSMGEKLANAYGIKIVKGKVKSVSLGTVPAILASAYVAQWAVGTVAGLASAAIKATASGNIPKWVGDIAWTTGKVVSNTPIR